MSALPPYFPTNNLSATDEQRVIWYYRRFVEEFFPDYRFGHFIMAGYAAVPALLTPDLLYKVWQNFYGYRWGQNQLAIHRIAVADFLLSPLCKEVGFELYEMHHEIRMAFQQWLNAAAHSPEWQGRGLKTVEEIAAFVKEYHQKANPGMERWGKGYQDMQEWGVAAYTDHNSVQKQLSERLLAAMTNKKEAEAMRLMDIWAKTAAQLEGLYGQSGQKDLSALRDNARMVEAWKALMQQGSDAFLEKMESVSRNLQLLDENKEGGIEVKIPSAIQGQIEEIQTQTIWTLGVALDEYEGNVSKLQGCVSDMERFVSVLKNVAEQNSQVFRCDKLTNKKATINAILEGFKAFEQARNGDICVFYFAGHTENERLTEQKGREFIAYNSRRAGNEKKVYQADIEALIAPVLLQKNVQILFVLDTHEVSNSTYKTVLDQMPHRQQPEQMLGRLVVLNACDLGQLSQENTNEKGIVSGQFTNALLNLLEKNNESPLTYRQIIARTKNEMRTKKGGKAQTPTLEAFPAEAGDYFFLSDKRDDTGVLKVAYDTATEQWVLQAGQQQGIRPSVSFYPTLVQLRNDLKQEWTVTTVHDTTAVLDGFSKKDTKKTYDVLLFQNAPEKVKIAFDPAMSEGVRAQLMTAITAWGTTDFTVTDVLADARFFFFNRGEQFLLRDHATTPQDDPFSYAGFMESGSEPQAFLKAVERVARWELVRQLGAPYKETGVRLELEKLEGVDFQSAAFLSAGTLFGGEPTVLSGTTPIELHYRLTDAKWLHPGLYYTVKTDLQPVYIHAVVLDTAFNIIVSNEQRLEPGAGISQSNIGVSQSNIGGYGPPEGGKTLVPFTVGNQFVNMGITARPAYVKIFVSEERLDLTILSQSEPASQVGGSSMAYGTPLRAAALRIGEKGLTGFTVPVVVHRNEVEIQQEQAAASAPPEEQTTQAEQAPTSPPPIVEQGTILSDVLNVYTSPGNTTQVVRTLKKGETINIIAREGTWVNIWNIQATTSDCRAWIQQNEFGKAFAALENLNLDSTHASRFAQMSAQFFQVRRQHSTGELDDKNYQQMEQRVLFSLSAFLEDLDKIEEWIEEIVAPAKIYIAYDQTDTAYLEALKKHLSVLIRTRKVEIWDSSNILPGQEWAKEMKHQIGIADYFIFLVSADALTNESLLEDQLELAEEADKRIIPIILRPCLWQELDLLSKIKVLPNGNRPVSAFERQDEAWFEIINELKTLLASPKSNIEYGAIEPEHTPAAPASFYPDKKIIEQMILGNKINMTAIAWHQLLLLVSKAVCRVVFPKGVGTGFLLEGGYLLTANHVISNPEIVAKTTIEFGYEMDMQGNVAQPVSYQLDPSTARFSPTDALNYAYIKVLDNPDQPLSQWGFLQIEEKDFPESKDPIVLIHHPEGQPKKVSFEPEGLDYTEGNSLYYKNDTAPGTSGAPVLNGLLHVVGLHIGRGDDENNYGHDIRRIMREIKGTATKK